MRRVTKALGSLPAIVAVVAFHDGGPVLEDGMATATCPHCGADGRYVYTFVCEDGSKRGAMKGCIKLFPRTYEADATAAAFEKLAEAKRLGRTGASWNHDIAVAAGQLSAGTIGVNDFKLRVAAALTRKTEEYEPADA